MTNIPYHLGIIIDGNRRWARERGLPTFEGHRRGFNKVKEITKWSKDRGIKILTLYCFSTENWNRSEREVSYLMRLLSQGLNKKEVKRICKEGIKIQIIGQTERLPKYLQKSIKEAEEFTQNNNKMILNLAISYGGRAEIVKAVKKIIKEKIPLNQIDENKIGDYLYTSSLPDPDLIIRTGGEQRVSNFLIWQVAYSELYFCKKYWPDFTEKDLDEVLQDFVHRQRRFGK